MVTRREMAFQPVQRPAEEWVISGLNDRKQAPVARAVEGEGAGCEKRWV